MIVLHKCISKGKVPGSVGAQFGFFFVLFLVEADLYTNLVTSIRFSFSIKHSSFSRINDSALKYMENTFYPPFLSSAIPSPSIPSSSSLTFCSFSLPFLSLPSLFLSLSSPQTIFWMTF